MADVFLCLARADRARAAQLAEAVEAQGLSLWWDGKLAVGENRDAAVEREIAAAGSVLVAWSKAARHSLRVKAQANAALDQANLVQILLDDVEPPHPFDMLPLLDFRTWGGSREELAWQRLAAQLDPASNGRAESARRPDPGGIILADTGTEADLQAVGRAAAMGWTALGVSITLALSVLLVTRDLLPAGAFGAISIAAMAVAAVLAAACLTLVLRVERASRG